MKRFAALLIFVPVGIVVIALAVANRQAVSVAIPPQIGDAPLYSFSLPLFALLFATLFAGMVIGSFATWISQGKHRKEARIQKLEATKQSFEAQKQSELAKDKEEELTDEQKALGALGIAPPSKVA